MRKLVVILIAFASTLRVYGQCTTTIVGPGNICAFAGPASFFTYETSDLSVGNWSLTPLGGTMLVGTTTNVRNVSIMLGAPATLTLTFTKTGCTPITKTITVTAPQVMISPMPAPASPWPTVACVNGTSTFNIPTSAGLVPYAWASTSNGYNTTLPGITTNATQTIVNWPSSSDEFIVYIAYSNGTCVGLPSQIIVHTLSGTTVPTITPSSVNANAPCANSKSTYKAAAEILDTFNWTLPSGGTILSQAADSVVVQWGNSGGPFNLQVTATSSCNPTPRTKTLAVTIGSALAAPATVTGPTAMCSHSSQPYTVSAVAGAISYKWSTSDAQAGLVAFDSTTTTTTGVTFLGTGTIKLRVSASNGSCYGDYKEYSVTVSPAPSSDFSIANPFGTTRACKNQDVTFNVVSPNSAYTYSWAFTPAGNGHFNGLPTGPSVSVNFAEAKNLTVIASIGTCVAPQVVTPITVDDLPLSTSSITGAITACKGVYNYSVLSNPTFSAINWTLSGGATAPISTAFSIPITWTTPGGPYVLTSSGTNMCGTGPPTNLSITVVNSLTIPVTNIGSTFPPLAPYTISPACPTNTPYYATGNYPVYTWSATGGTAAAQVPQSTGLVTWTSTGTNTVTVIPSNGTCQGNPVTASVVVNPITSQTITFPTLPVKTYGDPAFSSSATASSGFFVALNSSNPAVATISGTTITIVGAGTTDITASQPGNPPCLTAATPVVRTLTVNKAVLTATAQSQSKIYGSLNPTLTFSYSGFQGTDNSSVIDVQPTASTTGTQYSNVGVYPITLSGGSDNSYSFNFVNSNLTISKATVNAAAVNQTKVYGSANPTLTVQYTGLLGTDTGASIDTPPNMSTTATQFSIVQNYPISISGAADINYTFTYTAGTLSVTKAPLTVTATNQSKTYGTGNPTLSFTYSGFLGTDNSSVIDSAPTGSTTAVQYSNTGTYPISLSGGSDNNYSLTLVAGTLTVSKANLTAKADDKSKVYLDAVPALTTSYSGFLGTDNSSVLDALPSISTTATASSAAGSYPITLSGGSDNNYQIALTNGTLTISKANQTITLTPVNPLCVGVGAPLTATATSGLTVAFTSSNGSIFTVSGATATGVAAGSTGLVCSQVGDTNWNAAPNTGQMVTVNSSPNTQISASPSTTVCSGSSVVLTATGATNYSWTATSGATPPSTSPITVNPTVATTYTATGTTPGCPSSQKAITINVNSGAGTITLSPNQTNLCPSLHIQLTAGSGSNYHWTVTEPTGPPPSTTQFYIASQAGRYTVTYTSSTTGCAVSANVIIFRSGCRIAKVAPPAPLLVGIPKLQYKPVVSKSPVKKTMQINEGGEGIPLVYPIPADRSLIIQIDQGEGTLIRLVDMTGRIINQEVFEVNCNRKEIDTSNHAEGIYLLMITGPQGPVSRKVMIIHK